MDMEGQEHRLTDTVGANYNPHWGPCTLDAEGLCGQVPVPVPITHARAVSLALSKHLLAEGKVTCPDGVQACTDGVTVKIQRKTKSGWVNVRSAVTDDRGRYARELPDTPGRYRAVAKPLTAGGEACAKATSAVARHKH
jgi:hypothetical protein